MPIIPLVKNRPLPDVPAPVLDRERRPVVDNRGVAAAVGELADANRQPAAPYSLAEPYEALGAVGRAVQHAGSVIGAAAAEERKAETRIQVSRADEAIQSDLEEWEEYRTANPDPMLWQAERQKRLVNLRERLLSDETLNSPAREQIALNLAHYGRMENSRVQLAARKGKFALVGTSYIKELRRLSTVQDRPAYDAKREEARNSGTVHDHQLVELDAEYARTGRQLQLETAAASDANRREAVVAPARTRPEAWLAAHPDPDADDDNLRLAREEAELHRRRNVAGVSALIASSLGIGAIKVSSQIAALNDPRLTPERLELFGNLADSYLKGSVADAEARNDPERSREAMRELLGEALSYERTQEDPGESFGSKYATLHLDAARRLPTGKLAPVLTELDARLLGVLPEPDSSPDGFALHEMHTRFHPASGDLSWQTLVPEVDDAGNVKTDTNGNVLFRTIEDEGKKRLAIDAYVDVFDSYTNWRKENPDATLESVRKAFAGIITSGLRACAQRGMALEASQFADRLLAQRTEPEQEAQPADRGDWVSVRTPAEAGQLHAGTHYITPDGRHFQT